MLGGAKTLLVVEVYENAGCMECMRWAMGVGEAGLKFECKQPEQAAKATGARLGRAGDRGLAADQRLGWVGWMGWLVCARGTGFGNGLAGTQECLGWYNQATKPSSTSERNT